MKVKASYLLSIFILVPACSSRDSQSKKQEDPVFSSTNKVVLFSEIVWEKLNPARGDQSPQAGTIWGDRKGEVATGFLAKFVDGFSSPPHIHNVTYRAVVIKGSIHNDDEAAKEMWMTPGSFWTQPKGQPHITSAKGDENVAYVEIDYGPYLVRPTREAFESGEQPVNVDASNILWLDKTETNWIASSNEVQLSFLWEAKDLRGLFVKLPLGFTGAINSTGKVFHAVVISGNLTYQMPVNDDQKILDAGSYFSSTDTAIHSLSSESEAILYIRTDRSLKID